MTLHPFDKALVLEAEAAEGQTAHWRGATSPDYWNMVGPFGGTTAATALAAILRHPALLGEPVSLTVNYASALAEGDFSISATPVRTNRSTQHWTVSLSQSDAAGRQSVAMTATAVTAARRETWSQNDTPLPPAPFSDALPRLRFSSSAWTGAYDLRAVQGGIPSSWDGGGEGSLSQFWMRDDPPRPLDFPALAALCDVFYPRVWLRRATPVPAGTVTITTYFHADSGQLAQTGTGHLFGQARAQAFRNGFFDQTAQVWNAGGVLLATSHQLVYYKE